ncbi:hypothetical protein [Reichenbachiella ulvae]|nr:hypothetical protein [Reichenbachiella ulvae]MCV9389552.1 hypothetical protein [Reichenbachiella ulvae]
MHELFAGVKSLKSRINEEETDSLLKVTLLDEGIDLAYDFGIFDPLEEKFTIQQIVDSKSALQSSDL